VKVPRYRLVIHGDSSACTVKWLAAQTTSLSGSNGSNRTQGSNRPTPRTQLDKSSQCWGSPGEAQPSPCGLLHSVGKLVMFIHHFSSIYFSRPDDRRGPWMSSPSSESTMDESPAVSTSPAISDGGAATSDLTDRVEHSFC
jgi:hypothetical protein